MQKQRYTGSRTRVALRATGLCGNARLLGDGTKPEQDQPERAKNTNQSGGYWGQERRGPIRPSGRRPAIVVGERAYLVTLDQAWCGGRRLPRKRARPGWNRRILRSRFSRTCIRDHTAGYPDLILTPWVMGRKNWMSTGRKAGGDDPTRAGA